MNDVRVSAGKYYEQAKGYLEERDLLEFVGAINKAEIAPGVQDYLSQILSLKVKGLFKFSEYQKALEVLPEAEKCNSGEELIRLTNYKGVMVGYLGELDEARSYFVQNLDHIEDPELLVETYLNVVWADLSLYKVEPKEEYLRGAEQYLTLAREHVAAVGRRMKGKILDNLSVYYCYAGNLDEAIDAAEEAIPYFEEKDLPKVYNNLAAIYLKFDETLDVLKIVDEYTQKAEVIGTKYKNYFEVGCSFYTKAQAELRSDQLFTALDTLYLAFEYYKKAQAMSEAFEVMMTMNEIVAECNLERMKAFKQMMKEDFRGTSFYKKL